MLPRGGDSRAGAWGGSWPDEQSCRSLRGAMWQTRHSLDDLLPPRPNPRCLFTDHQVKLQPFCRSWHGLSGVAPSASLSAPFLPAPLTISIALTCHGTLRAKVPTTHPLPICHASRAGVSDSLICRLRHRANSPAVQSALRCNSQ
jgi:hypothetical protein